MTARCGQGLAWGAGEGGEGVVVVVVVVVVMVCLEVELRCQGVRMAGQAEDSGRQNSGSRGQRDGQALVTGRWFRDITSCGELVLKLNHTNQWAMLKLIPAGWLRRVGERPQGTRCLPCR